MLDLKCSYLCIRIILKHTIATDKLLQHENITPCTKEPQRPSQLWLTDSCFLHRRRREGSRLNISKEMSERLGCLGSEKERSAFSSTVSHEWAAVKGDFIPPVLRASDLTLGCVSLSGFIQGLVWGSLHLGQLSFKQLFILHLWQIFECFFFFFRHILSWTVLWKGLVQVLQKFGTLCVVAQKFWAVNLTC